LGTPALTSIAYDENGGFWDHVAPPTGAGWGDRWGPATRVPALITSPFARSAWSHYPACERRSVDLTNALDLP
jgi:phospholipase C